VSSIEAFFSFEGTDGAHKTAALPPLLQVFTTPLAETGSTMLVLLLIIILILALAGGILISKFLFLLLLLLLLLLLFRGRF
jgi:hypothetical protein